jgi:hypothetical protein
MGLAPEDLAVEVVEPEELIENNITAAEDFQMGTYTNYIKGQRDKDI